MQELGQPLPTPGAVSIPVTSTILFEADTCYLTQAQEPSAGNQWDLTPSEPFTPSDDGCPPGFILSTSKAAKTIMVSGPSCGPEGGNHSEGIVETKEGSVSVEHAGVTVSGRYAKSTNTEDAYQYGAGNGCGECVYNFKHRYIKVYTVVRFWSLFDIACFYASETYPFGAESGLIQKKCSRLNCPQ